MQNDNNAIEQAAKNLERAWNIHDAREFSLLFADDADFTNVFGMIEHGRQNIEQFHAPIFSTMFKASVLAILDTKIRFIKPDVAAVDLTWEMTGATDPNGQPWPYRKGLMNLIMTPENDTWVIAVMHNMDLPAMPHQ